MDRSAAPWRVLDDAVAGDRSDEPATETTGQQPGPLRLPHLTWAAIGGFSLAAVLAIGAFVIAASSPHGEITVEGGEAWAASSGGPQPSRGPASNGQHLVVDVQGAVLRPGVLELAPGARVGDAIAGAGGYSPRLDAERAARELNLAAAVKDGDRIVVPSRDDPPASSGPAPGGNDGGGAPGGAGGLVDLNSATVAELDKLPGVGPVTAQKIIDARAEKPFATVDELRERKIIGQSTFDKLHDLVTVR